MWSARLRAPVDPVAALGPLPEGARAEIDDGHLLVFVRRDMLHLDADALHDRLQHWTLTTLARELPAASAGLSFRHARPADPEGESTLDLQEGWLGLEPTFSLELAAAREGDVERFAALVLQFMELVEKEGRPEGFRSFEVGTME